MREAIEALTAKRQRIAFDANLYKRGIVTEYTRRCAREYDKLSRAIEALQKKKMVQGVLVK